MVDSSIQQTNSFNQGFICEWLLPIMFHLTHVALGCRRLVSGFVLICHAASDLPVRAVVKAGSDRLNREFLPGSLCTRIKL
jgi:hypothetical protein